MKTQLTKTEVENIVNGYLTQCFNNGTFGNAKSFEYQQYLYGEQYIKDNF